VRAPRIDAAGDSDGDARTWRDRTGDAAAARSAAAIILAVALFARSATASPDSRRPTATIEKQGDRRSCVNRDRPATGRGSVCPPEVRRNGRLSIWFRRTSGPDDRYGIDMDALTPAPLDVASHPRRTELEPSHQFAWKQLPPIEPIA